MAQGTTPKPSAADYPAHGEADGVAIGAEYMVHSFGSGEQMYLARNYLVVEVALYPPKDTTFTADRSRFELHVNGKKTGIAPQAPQAVAANLSHPEWQSEQPGVSAAGGGGGIGVGTGNPTRGTPFPGAPQQRLPAPPRAPDADSSGGLDRKTPVRAEEVLLQTALPVEPHRGPVSGFLFFPYSGKTGSIKSLELFYEGAVLKVR